MKAYIVLACDGRQDDGFYSCSGVSNRILDLEKIRTTEGYLELIKYLDRVPKLFNGICFKLNLVSNAVYKIYEMGYIDDKLYQRISQFYIDHRKCGITLAIVPKEV